MYKLDGKKPQTLILIVLISSPSVGATLFTPAIPAISLHFGAISEAGQLALLAYLIGCTVGPLIYAPLANRGGRKLAINVGLFIALAGSLLSALSAFLDSFNFFLIARFITALGASVGFVLTYLIINDYYYEHQARRVVPLVTAAFAVIPFASIAVGGAIVEHLNWKSCFYFLLTYYLLVLVLAARLPETASSLDEEATRLSVIAGKYLSAIQDPRLITFSVLFGMTTAMIYVFAAEAPSVAIKALGISAQNYGLLAMCVSFFYLSGSLSASWLAERYPAMKVIRWGAAIFGFAMASLLAFVALDLLNTISFFVPFYFAFFGYSLAYTNVVVLASSHLEDRPTGSSVMNFINMGMAVLAISLIGLLPGASVIRLPCFMVFVSLAYVLVYWYSQRYVHE